MQKNQFLKQKINRINSILKLEKDFKELKDIKLKDREVKIKRAIEKLFFESIIVSVDDMDRFKKEKKRRN